MKIEACVQLTKIYSHRISCDNHNVHEVFSGSDILRVNDKNIGCPARQPLLANNYSVLIFDFRAVCIFSRFSAEIRLTQKEMNSFRISDHPYYFLAGCKSCFLLCSRLIGPSRGLSKIVSPRIPVSPMDT